MYQGRLLAGLLHQGRDCLPEVAIVDGTLAEGKGHFLGRVIIGEIGSQSLAKLVDQIVGAKGGTRYVLNVCAVTFY